MQVRPLELSQEFLVVAEVANLGRNLETFRITRPPTIKVGHSLLRGVYSLAKKQVRANDQPSAALSRLAMNRNGVFGVLREEESRVKDKFEHKIYGPRIVIHHGEVSKAKCILKFG